VAIVAAAKRATKDVPRLSFSEFGMISPFWPEGQLWRFPGSSCLFGGRLNHWTMGTNPTRSGEAKKI
jgi:hypothetical protein